MIHYKFVLFTLCTYITIANKTQMWLIFKYRVLFYGAIFNGWDRAIYQFQTFSKITFYI